MSYNILATRIRTGNCIALVNYCDELLLREHSIKNMYNVGDFYTDKSLVKSEVYNCMYKNRYKSDDYFIPTHILLKKLVRICDNDIILHDIDMYIKDNTLINFGIIDEL